MSDLNENLAKIWNGRAKIFDESAEKTEDLELKASFHGNAVAYRICAGEMVKSFERMNDE